MLFALVIPLAMLLVGVVFLYRGWRGRPVDDHPICCRCGFDLFGLPETSFVCSECGSDVKVEGAVRIGHRVRRGGLILAGSGLVLPALCCWALVAWIALAQIDTNQYLPLWYLIRNTDSTIPATRDPATKEIMRRMQGKTLTAAKINLLVDHALLVQGDLKRPWPTVWGDIVEGQQAAGQLSPEKWQQYLKAILPSVLLEARPRVRRGAPLPLRLSQQASRVGSKCRIWVQCSGDGLELSGRPVRKANSGRGSGFEGGVSASGSGASTWKIPADEPALAGLAAGPQTVRMKFTVKIYDAYPGGGGAPLSKPAITTDLSLQASWLLVDGPTVSKNSDSSLAEAVKKAVTVRCSVPAGGMLSLNVDAKAPPASLAYEVFARCGEKQSSVTHMQFPAGKNHGWSTSLNFPAFDGDRLDIVLKPSLKSAEDSLDLAEMWDGGEIVIKDVIVQGRQNTPTTRKAK